MTFKKGNNYGKGRKKGSKNKKKSCLHLNENLNLRDPYWIDRPVVYFINCLGTSFCKIGISVNVCSRISNIDVATPHRLIVLGLIDFGDYKEVERILHKSLSFFHIKGEWFNLTEEIQKEVCKIKDYNGLMEFKGKYSNTLF